MATSEAILQVLLPRLHHSDLCTNSLNSVHTIKANVNNRRIKIPVSMQVHSCSRKSQNCRRVYALRSRGSVFHEKTDVGRLKSMGCQCQQAEGVSGFKEKTRRPTSNPINGTSSAPSIQGYEVGQQLKHEKEDLVRNGKAAAAGTTKDKLDKGKVNVIEDEAWHLLRNSIVYYCNNHVGTIAANDPSSSNIVNYDQVFIRDFIPSGIAFLLKGEYDIVRNFILHTLQLQVI